MSQVVKHIPVITIDGPSGSGKGTISQLLAKKLGWHYLDSGFLYRTLGCAALKQHIALTDVAALKKLAVNIKKQKIANSDIRTEACSIASSQVSKLPEVRQVLLEQQRNFRRAPGLVADGRDMGTVVFPDADIKIFLTASCKARAKRRYQQLQDQGINVSLPNILQDLKERDARDCERSVSPLKPAKAARIVDTTKLSIDEVLQEIIGLCETIAEVD